MSATFNVHIYKVKTKFKKMLIWHKDIKISKSFLWSGYRIKFWMCRLVYGHISMSRHVLLAWWSKHDVTWGYVLLISDLHSGISHLMSVGVWFFLYLCPRSGIREYSQWNFITRQEEKLASWHVSTLISEVPSVWTKLMRRCITKPKFIHAQVIPKIISENS